MKKKFIMLIIIFAIVLLNFTCVIVTDKNDSTLYDYGLTGYWVANSASMSDDYLRITNQTGSSINIIRYAVQPLEPTDWSSASSISTGLPIANGDVRDYQIGNGSAIDIGVALAATIWLKVSSGSNYLVGSFRYDSSALRWWLTVYTKN